MVSIGWKEIIGAAAALRAWRPQESDGREAFLVEGGDVVTVCKCLSGEKNPVSEIESCQLRETQ